MIQKKLTPLQQIQNEISPSSKLTIKTAIKVLKSVSKTLSEDEIATLIKNEMNITPSTEQITILKKLIDKENVIVNAVAGSGKTTLTIMLGICLKYLDRKDKIILLTYNKQLQSENDDKIKQYELSDIIKSKTIHGFGNELYLANNNFKNVNGVFNDKELDKLLKEKPDFIIPKRYEDVNYVILDEVQDLENTKIAFVLFLDKKFRQEITYLIIGDEKQTIYGFQGANGFFIGEFNQFIPKSYFHKLKLTQSYRVPNNICEILNKYFLKEEWMSGVKNTTGELTIINNQKAYNPYTKQENKEKFFAEIKNWISNKMTSESASEDDFFILVFSKKQSIELANYLSLHNFHIFKQDGNETIHPKEIKNKIYIGTMHSSKGRERKYVILPYFDLMAYAPFLIEPSDKEKITSEIPNLHYVALTRTKKDLLIGMSLDNNIPTKKNLHPKDIFAELENYSYLFPYIDWKELIKDNASDLHFKLRNKVPLNELYKVTSHTFFKRVLSTTATEIADFLPSILETKIERLLSQIETKWNGSLRDNELTHLKHSLKYEDRDYTNIMEITNAIYFLFYALRKIKPNLLQMELWNINSSIIKYKEFLAKYPNSKFLKQYEKWLNLTLSSLTQWDDLDTPNKLELLNLHLAMKSNDISKLSLYRFDWLKNFVDYDKILKVFAKLDLDMIGYEEEFWLEFYPDNITNIKLGWQNIGFKNDFLFDKKVVKSITIRSICDMLNSKSIIELKATDSISFEHKMQLITYLFLQNQAYSFFKNVVWKELNSLADLNRLAKTSKFYTILKKAYTISHKFINENTFKIFMRNLWLKFSAKNEGLLVNYKTGTGFRYENNQKVINEIMQILINHQIKTTPATSIDEVKKWLYENYNLRF